jgi:predicted phage-related endonuclease
MPFDITDEQKTDLIQKMAVIWGHVVAGTTMPPETLDQVKLLYPQDTPGTVKTASKSVEEAISNLSYVKSQIKTLEAQEEALQTLVQGYMETASSLQTFDGRVLATWKAAKASKRFDSKLFESAMPDIYQQFVVEQPGSRRFLLK